MAPQDPEKLKAYKAEWRLRNKEKIAAYQADYNAKNREKVLANKRDAERRRREREKAQQQQKAAAVERAKKWATAHPERVAQTKREWAAANPEKLKAARRAWVERNREPKRERENAWREANKDKIAEYSQRRVRDSDDNGARSKARRADPDVYARDLELNRDRRRLRRQLEKAGLPQPQLRKIPAVERRANGAAAREFFARVRTAAERRDLIRREDAPPTAGELREAAQVRAELRRRGEVQERLDRYVQRHGARLRREAELDSRAREIRGAEPLNVDAEVMRRARAEGRVVAMAPTSDPAARQRPEPRSNLDTMREANRAKAEQNREAQQRAGLNVKGRPDIRTGQVQRPDDQRTRGDGRER